MKKYFLIFVAFAFVVNSCKQKQEGEFTNRVQLVSPQEMKQFIDMNQVQLIDVRTPQEYESGHLTHSENLDFYDENFEAELDKLDKNVPVCIYCKSGGRSAKAAEILKKKGFKAVYKLDGGIMRWEKDSLPVDKSE
ncbi:MAG: rhodanese-like domain-containing protein [Flavobacteriales bacterium CG_4_9_14_3_um_filter_40_17]|nr:MAG: rhodanese-like domain-containing protein [Flavobacteriales bacterium CG_4_9_14_3_um_filter_40_17]